MPQMGVSVAEGTIVAWRKEPGDWVEADETVCDITTDKIDTEIPSPASGRLVEILVEVNETVTVGTPLARIDTGAQPGQPHAVESNGHAPAEATNSPDRSHVISPVVQRVADEHDVDLSQVTGTGTGGRIRKKDVLAFIDGAPQAKRPLHTESPYTPAEAAEPKAAEPEIEPEVAHQPEAAPEPELAPVPEPETANRELPTPLSPMRRQIAEHMVRSRRTAAHVTTVAEVDMSRVVARRAALKERYAGRGTPLTYLAFVARAAVIALEDQPVLNASVEGDDLVHHDDVNLGIAVALDEGLIVPVIQGAQHLGLEGIAAAIADLSTRARAKQLKPEDVRGGTFTITNPGQFGTVLATPIINQPQVAILDLEAVVKRAVVVESPEGDSIAVRPMVNLCLSFDHRALDGAEAARFLGAMKARLEQWADDV